MKFDVIIAGGGLSGLVTGVTLQKKGLRTLMVSSGESALHFFSGSFDFLGCLEDGTSVVHPLECLDRLDERHPYRIIGKDLLRRYADECKDLLSLTGVQVHGDIQKNHFRLTSLGSVKPTWLSLSGIPQIPGAFKKGDRVLIVQFRGYLDFFPSFIAQALGRMGVETRIHDVSLDALCGLRRNPSEMRSVQISRQMDDENTFRSLENALRSACRDSDMVILPSVFSLENQSSRLSRLKATLGTSVCVLPTMSLSVTGSDIQLRLQRCYEDLGGTLLFGDTVQRMELDKDRVSALYTANHGDEPFESDVLVLATGSFFSNGLSSSRSQIVEPLMGLDVITPGQRSEWFSQDLFSPQPYMRSGVKYTDEFRAMKNGVALENVYVCGGLLGGRDVLLMGSGGGVALMTALHVSELVSRYHFS